MESWVWWRAGCDMRFTESWVSWRTGCDGELGVMVSYLELRVMEGWV